MEREIGEVREQHETLRGQVLRRNDDMTETIAELVGLIKVREQHETLRDQVFRRNDDMTETIAELVGLIREQGARIARSEDSIAENHERVENMDAKIDGAIEAQNIKIDLNDTTTADNCAGGGRGAAAASAAAGDWSSKSEHAKMAARWTPDQVRVWLLRPDGPARSAVRDDTVLARMAVFILKQEIGGDIVTGYNDSYEIQKDFGVAVINLGQAYRLLKAIATLRDEPEPEPAQQKASAPRSASVGVFAAPVTADQEQPAQQKASTPRPASVGGGSGVMSQPGPKPKRPKIATARRAGVWPKTKCMSDVIRHWRNVYFSAISGREQMQVVSVFAFSVLRGGVLQSPEVRAAAGGLRVQIRRRANARRNSGGPTDSSFVDPLQQEYDGLMQQSIRECHTLMTLVWAELAVHYVPEHLSQRHLTAIESRQLSLCHPKMRVRSGPDCQLTRVVPGMYISYLGPDKRRHDERFLVLGANVHGVRLRRAEEVVDFEAQRREETVFKGFTHDGNVHLRMRDMQLCNTCQKNIAVWVDWGDRDWSPGGYIEFSPSWCVKCAMHRRVSLPRDLGSPVKPKRGLMDRPNMPTVWPYQQDEQSIAILRAPRMKFEMTLRADHLGNYIAVRPERVSACHRPKYYADRRSDWYNYGSVV